MKKKDMTSNTSPLSAPEFLHESVLKPLADRGIRAPDCAVILGSGLGKFTQYLEKPVIVPYSEIPGFPVTSVAGHDGALYFGGLQDMKVLVWSGRFRHYEGFPFGQTLLPVNVSNALGCNALLVTNAAGGINYRFQVGDLMLIDDIISLPVKVSPHNKRFDQRFVNDRLVRDTEQIALEAGIQVRRGCYLYAKGPVYETKAEIRAFRFMGADAVGMSTAPELLEAVRLGMSCLGISLITNLGTGMSNTVLDHSEIKEAASLRKKDFPGLITLLAGTPDSPIYKPEYRFR